MILDGASYHTCSSTRALISQLGLPVLFLGPYLYLIQPIELYWGMFKDADLNIDEIPTKMIIKGTVTLFK